MSEWKETNLFEIIDLIGGGTPKTSFSEYWNGDIPWLSVADFNNGKKFVFDTEKNITEAGLNNSSTKLLNKGDIIISARGTVGVVAVLGRAMTFNQSCYGIRPREELTTNDYVYYLLKDTVSGFLQIAHGGVFDTITRDTFKEIEINLPPLPEQTAIASILSSLDDKIDLLHRQNATLEKMAETLFRHWFFEEAKEDWEEVKITDLFEVRDGTHDSPKQKDFGKKLITSKHLSKHSIDFESAYFISDEDFEDFEHSLLPKRNDTITLPDESYHTLSRAPYRDTLMANFHTGFGLLPTHIWKVGDTIKVKRWDSIMVINPDTLDNYLSRKYLTHEYFIGGLFHDGRVVVYFYRTDDFLLRNDTLFSWQQKTTLPADSTFKLALRHRIFDDGRYDFMSEYLQILNDNSYWEFGVLFYKGIGCNRVDWKQPYFTHQIVMEDYWKTDFGVFFKFIHHSNTNFSGSSNNFRTPYIINDRFEFYQLGFDNKRIEAVKLEFLESDFEKFQLKYCQ